MNHLLKNEKLLNDLFQNIDHAFDIALRKDLQVSEKAKLEIKKKEGLQKKYGDLINPYFFSGGSYVSK